MYKSVCIAVYPKKNYICWKQDKCGFVRWVDPEWDGRAARMIQKLGRSQASLKKDVEKGRRLICNLRASKMDIENDMLCNPDRQAMHPWPAWTAMSSFAWRLRMGPGCHVCGSDTVRDNYWCKVQRIVRLGAVRAFTMQVFREVFSKEKLIFLAT